MSRQQDTYLHAFVYTARQRRKAVRQAGRLTDRQTYTGAGVRTAWPHPRKKTFSIWVENLLPYGTGNEWICLSVCLYLIFFSLSIACYCNLECLVDTGGRKKNNQCLIYIFSTFLRSYLIIFNIFISMQITTKTTTLQEW